MQLVPSPPDMITLCDALGDRLLQLDQLHVKVTGLPLTPDTALLRDMELFETLFTRHRSHDNRHTLDEKHAVRRLAQWSVTVKCKLTKQPLKVIEWGD